MSALKFTSQQPHHTDQSRSQQPERSRFWHRSDVNIAAAYGYRAIEEILAGIDGELYGRSFHGRSVEPHAGNGARQRVVMGSVRQRRHRPTARAASKAAVKKVAAWKSIRAARPNRETSAAVKSATVLHVAGCETASRESHGSQISRHQAQTIEPIYRNQGRSAQA